MTTPVFLHPVPEGARAGMRFSLTGAEARHAEVTRLRAGELLRVSDGESQAALAMVCAPGEGAGAGSGSGSGSGSGAGAGVVVEIVELLEIPTPRPRVTVVQAIPKSDRAELAIDLMVQAGVDHIIPWAATRCVSRWDNKEAKAKAKWENAARAAAKQSRRVRVPVVDNLLKDPAELLTREPLTGAQILSPATAASGSVTGVGADRSTDINTDTGTNTETTAQRTASIIALHEEASTPFATQLFDVDELVLIIGPEGGISPEELEVFTSFGAGRAVLGPEVLRAANAAAVALGAIGVLTSRWNPL